jgi:hypothetical protein
VTAAELRGIDLDVYQHDSTAVLRFVLRGNLAGVRVRYLEHAWITATSTLGNRKLLVDVAGLRDADADGMELLSRMRSSGAQLVAGTAPCSTELTGRLSVPVPTVIGKGIHDSNGPLRVLRAGVARVRSLFRG